MNLKERLTSTENLLRAIRSGEAFSSLARRKPTPDKPTPGTPAPGTPAVRAASIWSRHLFQGLGKGSAVLGVSISSGNISLALVSGGRVRLTRRFHFGPDQAFGEKDFTPFLRTSLEVVRSQAAGADVWAVLRSQDMDLNVLSVPKLSGAKLDAAVYWTLQKEKKFAEAEYVLDYLPMGPTEGAKEPRLDVLTCLARRADVDRLRDSFRDAGWPLAGITTVPSAFLNLYAQPGLAKDFTLAANIHVEKNFTAIGLYTADRLLFSRFIRFGTDSMSESLVEHFQELSKPKPAPPPELELPLPGPARPAPSQADSAPDQADSAIPPLTSAQAHGLLHHVLLGTPSPEGLVPGHVISEDKMLEIISPSIERLAKQVERTLEFFATASQRHCDAAHFSGRIFGAAAVLKPLAAQLGFPPVAFDAVAIVDKGSEAVAPDQRMVLAPTLAAALSAPHKGINLLRNYKLRSAEVSRRTVTRSLVLGLAASLMVVAAAGFWIERGVTQRRTELALVQQQLQAMGPALDEGTINSALVLYKSRQDKLREAATRYLAPAVLAELARRAPPNVKIVNLTIDMLAPAAGPPQAGQQPRPGQQPPGGQRRDLLVVEGVILGSKAEFEATLSRLIIEMQASPLFSLPVVHQTGLKELGTEGQVLYFVLHAGVV